MLFQFSFCFKYSQRANSAKTTTSARNALEKEKLLHVYFKFCFLCRETINGTGGSELI